LDTRSRSVVVELLAIAFPDLVATRPRLLLAGQEFDTWFAGDAIVKFPRGEGCAAKLEREAAANELLVERLGGLVPTLRALAGPSETFPFPIGLFEQARGRQGQRPDGPIIRPRPWARERLAMSVAGALTALHTSPAKRAKAAGLGPLERNEDLDVGEEAIAQARKIAGDAVDTFLVDPLPSHARKPGKQVLCHADLKGEHVYVSEDGTRLTAVVDWADIGLAEPAVDLAGLAIWLGPGFVREVMVAYEGPADDATADRAIFLARAGLLGYLDDVLEGREDPPAVGLIEAQLRAAFADD
jgi:aminoglycoside phosphotransferase (APT) family kinase protein